MSHTHCLVLSFMERGMKMVRVLTSKTIVYGKNKVSFQELAGLSTDTKPTDGLATGSSFLEVDTSDVYFYDEVGQTWHKAGENDG